MKITLYCSNIFEALDKINNGKRGIFNLRPNTVSNFPVEIDLEKYNIERASLYDEYVYVSKK